ncbi:MAG TPA: hypothetical protein VLD58_14255 [Gemmatimonadales bacterium]|nr:hypothetical protein [Gemmatimonadales bacterium]
MPELLLLVLVAAVLVWFFSPGTRQRETPDDPIEPVDESELDAAEREVRDLDLNQRPEDGFEGDDWGPGAGGTR